jgi:K+-transporting ATPase ATPase A chain
MSLWSLLDIGIFLAVVLVLVKPLGCYMAQVFDGRPCGLDCALGWLERGMYWVCRVDPREEMSSARYAATLLVFNLLGVLTMYGLQRVQHLLPLNPQKQTDVQPDLAMNTAVSFVTNTNWQAYGGETTMSYLTQMLGMTVHNFLSAAASLTVMVVLIRGFVRRSTATVGNFWFDLTRSTLYVLLPMSVVVALFFVSQGVVQTFRSYETVTLVEPLQGAPGKTITEQTIAVGPAASQVAIKQLGTNGGGFFNANSAHPLENPTPLCCFVELLTIVLIPAAQCYAFGRMVGDTRQGWVLLGAMLLIFTPLAIITAWAEEAGNPAIHALGSTTARATCKPVATWKARTRGSEMDCRHSGLARRPAPAMAASTPCTIRSLRWAD